MIFYCLSNKQFEGWEIILKVWPFISSNRQFETVTSKKTVSDGLCKRLYRQRKFDARVEHSLFQRLPQVALPSFDALSEVDIPLPLGGFGAVS